MPGIKDSVSVKNYDRTHNNVCVCVHHECQVNVIVNEINIQHLTEKTRNI